MASISARSEAVLAAFRSDSQSWETGFDGRSIRLKMLSMFNMADPFLVCPCRDSLTSGTNGVVGRHPDCSGRLPDDLVGHPYATT